MLQFRVKRLLFLVRGSHGRCISTYEGSQSAIAELQLESHQARVDTLWLIRQLRYQRVLDCKTNPMLSRLTLGMTRCGEGIARTELHELMVFKIYGCLFLSWSYSRTFSSIKSVFTLVKSTVLHQLDGFDVRIPWIFIPCLVYSR